MIEILGFPAWQLFAMLGIALSIAEMLVPGFVLLPIGLGFLLSAFFVAFTESAPFTWAILAVSLVAVFAAFRKWAHKGAANPSVSGIERLIGQPAALIESIEAGKPGRIKVSADIFYALSLDGSEISAPQSVVVLRFEGNKAVVRKIE